MVRNLLAEESLELGHLVTHALARLVALLRQEAQPRNLRLLWEADPAHCLLVLREDAHRLEHVERVVHSAARRRERAEHDGL